MKFVDLIERKKQGCVHSREEICYIVNSIMNGEAYDYQISAWLMAMYFKGMTEQETSYFTEALANSGKTIDFEELKGLIVDKHSTGGVGDKVTITLVPLLAAAGVPVAKLADRGLGHSAGTVDKLESIPGFNTELEISSIVKQVKEISAVIHNRLSDKTNFNSLGCDSTSDYIKNKVGPALSSTSVIPDGTPTTTLGLPTLYLFAILYIMFFSINCVAVKSAITPSFNGLIALICSGVLPSISFAS